MFLGAERHGPRTRSILLALPCPILLALSFRHALSSVPAYRNVWDGSDPPGDKSVDTEDLPRGRYEAWEGGVGFCTKSKELRGVTVDIKGTCGASVERPAMVYWKDGRMALDGCDVAAAESFRLADIDAGRRPYSPPLSCCACGRCAALCLAFFFFSHVTDPLTACPNQECAFGAPLTRLANEIDVAKRVFDPNRGVKRTLRFDDLTVGREQCDADGWGESVGDVFYTDPFCTKVVDGPGPNAVRQVMRRGWSGWLGGKFHSRESWYGRYVATDDDDESGGFEDIERALDEGN